MGTLRPCIRLERHTHWVLRCSAWVSLVGRRGSALVRFSCLGLLAWEGSGGQSLSRSQRRGVWPAPPQNAVSGPCSRPRSCPSAGGHSPWAVPQCTALRHSPPLHFCPLLHSSSPENPSFSPAEKNRKGHRQLSYAPKQQNSIINLSLICPLRKSIHPYMHPHFCPSVCLSVQGTSLFSAVV